MFLPRSRARYLAALVAATLLVLAGRRFLVRIVERSMVPALLPGDYVLAFRLRSSPRRGDVLIFEHPRRSGFLLVKRVIGLPGERVTISDLGVHVDGVLVAEPWAQGLPRRQGSWRVAEGEAYVLGDRREWSADDSRSLGPVPTGKAWRVAWRVWPIRRIGRPH